VAQKDSFAAEKIYTTMNEMNIERIGVVTANTGFGNGGMEQLKKYASEYGISIPIAESYDKGATDLTAVLTKLQGHGIEAVVNWSIVPAQSIIPKNMRQLGMDMPLFQSHGFANIKYAEAAGEAAEGIIFPAGRIVIAEHLPGDHPQKEVLMDYKKSYESRYEGNASTFGGHAYDALMILRDAIQQAESTDRAEVRDAIEQLDDFPGIGGVFDYSAEDHNGLSIDAFAMVTVKNGEFVPYNQ
jgi:branched-chain amino acid transport system substrate-binding protein